MTAPLPGFPEGFLWGAATSSHQVEGNNRWNDWWVLEQSGALPYRSGDACRHYELFEQDFDLARALGHNAHRFSLEWSRLEPEPGRWDDSAFEHYREVLEALRHRGLEPIVCLHHFTNPAWFARRGGWLAADSADLFVRYVEGVAERLDGVRYWLTINEPTVYAKNAYVGGLWPPQRKGSWSSAARVLRNMARGHRAAYRALHRRHPGARVGFAHSIPWIEPCDPRRALDRMAARGRDLLLNRSFLTLIGGRGSLDFLGINYYTRTVVRWAPGGLKAVAGTECLDPSHGHRGVASDIGWEVYPPGLGHALASYADVGVPIMVSENGIATTDERLRSRFLRDHLTEVAGAIGRGVPILGYIHWTLMDNYEWSLGTAPRFGLLATDYDTQTRTPRPAALELAEIARANRLPASAPEHG
jgi:beta-glucosidase